MMGDLTMADTKKINISELRNLEVKDTEFETFLNKAQEKTKLTEPGHHFCTVSMRCLDFLNFLFTLAQNCDHLAKTYAEVFEEKKIDGEFYVKYFRNQAPFLLEIMICKQIDEFTSYFSELLRLILKANPSILKSGDRIKVEEILKFESMDELTAHLIENKIMELSYQSFTDLGIWLEERLGVDLFDENDEKEIIIELIETRNIIVHNRGKIGTKYLKNVKSTRFKIGELRKIDIEYFARSAVFLILFLKSFDQKISKKFKLVTR